LQDSQEALLEQNCYETSQPRKKKKKKYDSHGVDRGDMVLKRSFLPNKREEWGDKSTSVTTRHGSIGGL